MGALQHLSNYRSSDQSSVFLTIDLRLPLGMQKKHSTLSYALKLPQYTSMQLFVACTGGNDCDMKWPGSSPKIAETS